MGNIRTFSKRFVLLISGLMALSVSLGPNLGLSMELGFSPTPRIVVKFEEGLEVRLSEGRISGHPSSNPEVASELENRGLPPNVIEESFETLREVLRRPEFVNIQPKFSDEAHGLQPEGPLPGERNLQLYFSIALDYSTPQQVDTLVSDLTALPIVETAYQAPFPEDAEMELPTD